jgi:hypothetical protein
MSLVFSRDQFFNQAKIVSIKLFRAKMLDALVGTLLSVTQKQGVSIPMDIDDLEVSDADVLSGTTRSKTPGITALNNMKTKSATNNPLNWQRVDPTTYIDNLREFRKNFKKAYTTKMQAFIGALKNPDTFQNVIMEQDITLYSQITALSRDLTFNNSCNLTISLVQLRELRQTMSGTATGLYKTQAEQRIGLVSVPRENDVIEIIVEYPSGILDRAFIGLVASVEQIEDRGQITAINITCAGLSKLLIVNRMVTDRAVISQFEDGEIAQVGLSVMSTGTFAENTVDQIFTTVMASQLALTTSHSKIRGSLKTRLMTERSLALTSQSVLNARIQELTKYITYRSQEKINEVNTAYDQLLESIQDAVDNDATEGLGFKSIAQIQTAIASKLKVQIFSWDLNSDQKDLLQSRLADAQLDTRLRYLNEAIATESEKPPEQDQDEGTKVLKIGYSFDRFVFSDADAFQLVYIPLITMMMVRSRKLPADPMNRKRTYSNRTVAIFSGRQATAYDYLIRKGFQLFFSQLKTPNSLLEEIRTKAKFMVYENQLGQIVCEIPRYNEFVADLPEPGDETAEKIEDFIIMNPSNLRVMRQDMDMLSRVDVRGYAALLGELPTGTATWGQYTDIAVMSKYGTRAEAPIYNPNTSFEPKSRLFFAAVELIAQNARTRTMSCTVIADRPYKTGRLYFVSRRSLDMVAGGPSGMVTAPVTIDGYVGYLQKVDMTIAHGSPMSYNLSFSFVRRARLLEVKDSKGNVVSYVANFRILPDIAKLMDVMEEAYWQAKTDLGIFGREALKPTSPRTAKVWEHDVEGQYYVSDIYPNTDSNKKLLSMNYIREREDGDQPYEPFVTTSSREGHHSQLPPNTRRDIDGDKLTAVIRVEDCSDGLKAPLIDSLCAIDMRLRATNRAILACKNRISKASIATQEMNVKNRLLKPIYLPTETINPFYRLAGLDGLSMKLIDPHAPDLSPPEGVVNSGMFLGNNHLITTSDFSLASGDPVRLDKSAYSFVILKIHPEIHSGQSMLPDMTASANQLKNGTTKSAIVAYVSAVTSHTVSSTVVNNAINNLPAGDDRVYLPVLFHGSYANELASFVAVIDPGIPLTIYDAAGMPASIYEKFSTFRFPAVATVEPNAPTEKAIKHSSGEAIDITLFPWYARTGLILHKHDFPKAGYILGPDYICYDQLNPEHPHDRLYSMFFKRPVMVKRRIPTKPQAEGTIAVGAPTSKTQFQGSEVTEITKTLLEVCHDLAFRISKKDSDNQKDVAQKTFENMIKAIGIEEYFKFTDLNPEDQVFYHLEI